MKEDSSWIYNVDGKSPNGMKISKVVLKKRIKFMCKRLTKIIKEIFQKTSKTKHYTHTDSIHICSVVYSL